MKTLITPMGHDLALDKPFNNVKNERFNQSLLTAIQSLPERDAPFCLCITTMK